MDTLTVEIVVPDWVNWIAVDENGVVYGYEEKPRHSEFFHGEWIIDSGDMCELYKGKPPKNWKDELYTWG